MLELAGKLEWDAGYVLLAQLCVRHELTLLTTDGAFGLMAKHCPLRIWQA